MSEQDMVEQVAKAIYAAFDATGEYVGDQHFAGRVETPLDGSFDLKAIARAAIEAMRELSDAMVLVGTREITSESPQTDCREAWRAMIDKALESK